MLLLIINLLEFLRNQYVEQGGGRNNIWKHYQ